MKTQTIRKLSSPLSRLLILSAVFGVTQLANAASDTWNSGSGSGNNWSDSANWGGTAPVAGDSLFFGSGARTSPNDDFANGTFFGNLIFTSGSPAFTLGTSSGGIVLSNAIDTGGNGQISGGGVVNLSLVGTAASQTVNLPVTFSAGSHFIHNVSGAGGLNLSGTITRNTGATVVFTNSSANNINVTGSGLANLNGILGAWATIGTGAGQMTNWASLDGSGNVIGLPSASFTGVAAAGAIASGAAQNIKITSEGTAITSPAGTVDINTLYLPINSTAAQSVNPSGILRFGSQGGILNASGAVGTIRNLTIGASAGSGTITAGGADNTAGELTIYDAAYNSTGNDVTLNSIIADNGSGVVKVNIVGYVAISANVNTYSGGTYINQGRVQSGGVSCLGTGPVYVFPGGEEFHNAAGNWANNVFLAGVGTTESGGLGAIRMKGSTITGTVTLMTDAAIGGGNNAANVISGKITGPGGLIIGHGTSNNGSGTVAVGSAGGANDYQGNTTIHQNTVGNDTLKITAAMNNIMPNGSAAGNVIINGNTFSGALDLDGTAQSINGLSSTGTGTSAWVSNSIATAATLTLGNNNATATFSGIIGSSLGSIAITKTGNGTQTLNGPNTYSGATTVSQGKLVTTTASTGAGSYSVADGATLDVQVAGVGQQLNVNNLTLGTSSGCTLQIDTAALGNPTATPIKINGTLTVNGTVTVNLFGTALTTGTFTILAAAHTPGSFTLVASPRLNATIDDTDGTNVKITLTNPDTAINWDGSASGNWDINNSGNLTWKGNTSGTATDYTESGTFGNDAVQFTDASLGTTTVNLTTTLSPAAVVVNNTAATATANYVFSGSGKISGTTGLTKNGTGSLTLSESGGDNFSGVVTVNNGTLVIDNNSGGITGGTTIGASGTVQVGNSDGNGVLPAGNVTDGGSLVFNRTGTFTTANAISGGGALTQNANGINTLSGVNSYGGTTTISAGTIRVTTTNALGVSNPGGTVTISGGGTFDLGGISTVNIGAGFGTKQFNISGTGAGGNGAIVNNGGQNQQNAFQKIALAADATIGGDTRWDIRNNSPTLDLAGFTLTKTGLNQISCVSPHVTSGNIIINQGILSFESTPNFDASAGTITVDSGGYLGQFKDTSASFTRSIVLHGGGTTNLSNSASSSTTYIDATVLLTANSTLGTEGGTANIENFDGIISDGGNGYGLSLYGSGTSAFLAANTYSGNTTINAGSTLALSGSGSINNTPNIIIAGGAAFDVSGLSSPPFVLGSSQTLSNSTSTAALNGSANTGSGTVSLTYASGTPSLTVSNGTLTLTSSATFKVNNTGAALASGNYNIISIAGAGNVGLVAGTVPAVTVGGGGVAAGQHSSLAIVSGQLYLLVTNQAPVVANIVTNNVTSGTTWKVAIADLKTAAGWSDPDGDTVTLSGVTSPSANGATITSDASYVYYNGPVTAEDHFTYTVTDGYLTANGTVYVEAVASTAPSISNPAVNGSGHPTFSGHGIPGYTYGVESSPDMSPGSWVNAGTVLVGGDGSWSFTDAAQTNPNPIFYRLYYPYSAGSPPQ